MASMQPFPNLPETAPLPGWTRRPGNPAFPPMLPWKVSIQTSVRWQRMISRQQAPAQDRVYLVAPKGR